MASRRFTVDPVKKKEFINIFLLMPETRVDDAMRKAEFTKKDIAKGLLLLWLVMESVCGSLREKRVALLSDNSPTVGWVHRLATWGTMVSAHLIRALALQLKLNGTCPITPLHIAGEENSMTDIPSRSFGSEPKWHCKSNTNLLILFNNLFPFPLRTPGPSSKFPMRSACE